jgi:hypothetical protein
MENVLNFTIHKQWTLHVANFENYTKGCSSWEKVVFLEEKTPEEIYQIVIDLENNNRKSFSASKHRNVAYCYWVTESEIMTDDRIKFGHENQSSEKGFTTVIPKTYVRGEVLTVAEAIMKIETFGNLSKNERTQLIEFIYDSRIDTENPTEKELLQKIVKIPGEGKRETFFEFIDEFCEVSVFSENDLVPIQEN